MPAGLIDEQRGVRARRDLGGDFGQVQVHGFGVTPGQDEGSARRCWADCAEYISRGGSLISGKRSTRSALGPTAGDLVLLADARLVGEPGVPRWCWSDAFAADLFQALGKTFLKSSIAPSAWA